MNKQSDSSSLTKQLMVYATASALVGISVAYLIVLKRDNNQHDRVRDQESKHVGKEVNVLRRRMSMVAPST